MKRPASSRWEQLGLLFPELSSVFIGDSGQGDAIFGARAAAANGDIRAVFIHDVTGLDVTECAAFAGKGVRVRHLRGRGHGGIRQGAHHGGGAGARDVCRITRVERGVFEKADQRAARQAELTRVLELARVALSRSAGSG